MKRTKLLTCLLAATFATGILHAADNARFDLAGPKIDIRVTRGAVTLPIAQVPNLRPGDKLWIKADLPPTQSNHLFLVVAFLRGTTNEPPDNWFTEIDTWTKKTGEGTFVTVPAGAEQALLFVAPETGGDFKTLRSAVKGKPGVFIRADADLNEASFEQQRIERYLAAMKTLKPDDAKAIKDHSAKLAVTLALKPDDKCLKLPVDQQVVCLTQSSAPLLLDDGHGKTIAEAVSTGSSSDFINAAAATPAAAVSVYSAYVGAVVDLVHLVGTLRTAQYQYIPAISFPQEATLNLKLNAPPSFHKPESVIVIGLPAIQIAHPPPLHPQTDGQVACLLQPKLSLLLGGAPLVFSTSFARDLVLHLNRTGENTDLPLTPNAFEGGLIVGKATPTRHPLPDDKPAAKPDAKPGSPTDLTITGTVRGYWGFDSFEGPTVKLQQVDGKGFKIVGDTQLMAGQDAKFSLEGDGTACVQKITLTNDKATDEKDKNTPVNFKPATGDKAPQKTLDTLALDVSLKKVQPGGYSLAIQQYGAAKPDDIPLTAYNSDIKLADVTIHAGDNNAVLTGQGLKDVASVEMGGQTFTPTGDNNDDKTVHLQSKAAASPDNGADAVVKLKDGRTLKANITAAAARPTLKLLSFKATPAQLEGTLPVMLGAKNDIPLDGKLTFVVHTDDVFPRTQTIEVATADGGAHTTLSLASNNLVLQDDHTAVATLDPLKAFGQSAFGKLAMRPVAADGTSGDWTALGTLVRSPQITAIHCTTPNAATCSVEGKNLFLVQSFAAGKDFAKPTDVPTGFADASLNVPTPAHGTTLYLKLRDDPSIAATVTLPNPIPSNPVPTAAAAPAAPAPAAKPTPAPAAPAIPAPAAATPASSPATPPATQSTPASPAPAASTAASAAPQ
jgi:hypothetical protein